MKPVAIVDDDSELQDLLGLWLRAHSIDYETHSSAESILMRAPSDLGVVCLDLGLPKMGGLEVLNKVRLADPNLPVIVVTGRRDPSTVVAAMRAGAYDYLVKPVDLDDFGHSLRRALERRSFSDRIHALESASEAMARLLGESSGMAEVKRQITSISNSNIAVCILGESGVGKELVAKAIHGMSDRCSGPFVAINCGAIPDHLQESELFGHERGAFTGATDTFQGRFEQASGGTLFLDEVGEMAAATQIKLLRVLQEKTFRRVGGARDLTADVRVISATNRNLEEDARLGRFRSDLYYRLVAYPLHIPPLRERSVDIPILAAVFLEKFVRTSTRSGRIFTQEALECMARYSWPGNVRELENVVHRAVLCSQGEEIRTCDLPEGVRAGFLASSPESPPMGFTLPVLKISQLTELAYRQAVERHKGSVDGAAQELGIGRATLYRWLSAQSLSSQSRANS